MNNQMNKTYIRTACKSYKAIHAAKAQDKSSNAPKHAQAESQDHFREILARKLKAA